MGLVIVLVDAPFGGYDGVPDPLGWALVLAGLLGPNGLAARAGSGPVLAWLAGVALLVSLATYPPAVLDGLSASAGWALSMPALGFGFVLCGVLADVAPDLRGRFRALRWIFVLLAAAPPVVLGGGVAALEELVALVGFVGVVGQAYLVYLLFRAPDVREGRHPVG